MNYRLNVILLSVGVLAVAPLALAIFGQEKQREESDLPERDEIRQTYKLLPGARVEVMSISGPVEIETANTDTAEVHIIRSARSRVELDSRKIIIEQTATSLVVHGEENSSFRFKHSKVRQHVMLKLPRQIELVTRDINGHVSIGEVDGPVRISDVNSKVEVAQAIGYAEISDVNSSVIITIAQLGERGIRLNDINGKIELHFAGEPNADLSVKDINGNVFVEIPNVTVQGKLSGSNFHARIGSGGSPISITDVNGSLHLAPAIPRGQFPPFSSRQ